MKKQPEGITVCKLEVVLMPQGEIICKGKTMGWFKDLGEFLTEQKLKIKTTTEGTQPPCQRI